MYSFVLFFLALYPSLLEVQYSQKNHGYACRVDSALQMMTEDVGYLKTIVVSCREKVSTAVVYGVAEEYVVKKIGHRYEGAVAIEHGYGSKRFWTVTLTLIAK